MKIYLAGRINGDPDYHAKFAKAADELRAQGHTVFNPAAANQEGRPLAAIMAHLIPQLCECEAIALMPCWMMSHGARIEHDLADYLGLRIIYL